MTHRPFIGVVLSFALGIFLVLLWPMNFKVLGLAAAALFFLSGLIFQNYRFSVLFLFLGFVCLGAFYLTNHRALANNDLAVVGRYYSRKEVRLKGTVVSDITRRPFFRGSKSTFELQVELLSLPQEEWRAERRAQWHAVQHAPRKVRGRVLVNIFRDVGLAYGDEIILEGKLHRPFNFASDTDKEKFSYRDYLERKGIVWMLSVKKKGRVEVVANHQGNFLKDLAMRSRHRLKRILDQNLSAHESALMQALLLGNRTQIPKPLEELFLHTGTAHILAISGMNIAIVATFILLILKLLPIARVGKFLLTILLLFFYMVLTGAPPSVIRASIMAIVLLSGFLLERETDIFNSLAFAAFLLLLMNPMNLLDVGCQLSFISVLAIILLYPVILEKLSAVVMFDRPLPQCICQAVAVSIAAWLGVAGLIAYYFQIITPVTVLANLFIVSLMTVIVFLGLGLLLTGLILPVLNMAFAACIKVTINVMILIVYLMEQLPGAYFELPKVSLTQALIYYLAFSALVLILRKKIAAANFRFLRSLSIDKPA